MSAGAVIAITAVGLLLVLAAAAALIFRRMMTRPMYNPGDMRGGKNLRGPLNPPDQPGDAQLWTVEEDVDLYHFSAGKGDPVLMIHGGPGYPFLRPWTGLGPLENSFEFHYYDQRGCGRSTRPIDRFSSTRTYENIQTLERTLGVGAQLADIERVRRILGEEKLLLIGQSFGSFMASLYAAEFPEQVRAMVLVAPADMLLMPPAHGGLFEAVKERLPEDKQAGYDAYLEEYFNFKGIFDKSEEELAAFNGQFESYYRAIYDLPEGEQEDPGGWMVQAHYFSLGKQHDYRSALKAIEAPVLVIHGEDDLQPEAVSQMYIDALPNGRLEIISGAGHFSYEEQPAAFGAAVGQFLKDL